MASCEKCWSDAYVRMLQNPDKSQTDHYIDLLNEREKIPCSPKEQAGNWWDEENQCDSRELQE
jgi:hypothetical protein